VQKLIEEEALQGKEINRLKKVHMHMIGDQADMLSLGTSSKYNIDLEFLVYLKDLGRDCADRWLSENWDALGKKSTLDIREMLQGDNE
jgi:NTE family protein